MIDIEKLIDKLLEKEIVDKLTIEVMGIVEPYINKYKKEISFDTYMTSMCDYEEFLKVRKWLEENNNDIPTI